MDRLALMEAELIALRLRVREQEKQLAELAVQMMGLTTVLNGLLNEGIEVVMVEEEIPSLEEMN